jgi:hypothetical protein
MKSPRSAPLPGIGIGVVLAVIAHLVDATWDDVSG